MPAPAPVDQSTPTHSGVALAARVRAWCAVAAIAAGFIIGRALTGADAPPMLPSTAWFGAALLIAGLTLVGRARFVGPLLTLAAVTFAAGWWTLRLAEPPRDPLRTELRTIEPHGEPILVTLRGLVTEHIEPVTLPADSAERFLFAESSPGFTLLVDAVEAEAGVTPINGRVTVWIDERPGSFAPVGERVRATGWLRPPLPPMNPAEPDRQLYAQQTGQLGSLSVSGPGVIEQLDDPRGVLGTLAAWRAYARDRAAAIFAPDGKPDGEPSTRAAETEATLRQILLGAPSPASEDVRLRFTRIGVGHLLAISGFHLAILAGCILLVARTAGDFDGWEQVLVIVLIATALALLPVRTPIVRAGLLVLAVLGSELLGRRYDRLTLLGWICAGMLLWRPMDLFALGFQLTFGITALFMWVASARHPWVFSAEEVRTAERPRTSLARRAMLWLRSYAVLSTLPVLVAWPTIAYHTGVVSPLAPIATMLITPLVVVALASGYAAMLVAILSPALAEVGAIIAQIGAGWAVAAVSAIDNAGYATMHIPRVSLAWTIAATLAAIAFIRIANLRSLLAWTGLAGATLWLLIEITLGPRLPGSVALRVDALHVSDGSCLLIRSGSEAVLWDCGSLTPRYGQRRIPQAIRELGAGRVRTAIITHDNLDHYGALADAAPWIGLERVLVSRPALDLMIAAGKGPEAAFLRSMDAAGVTVEPLSAGDRLAIGPARLDVLWPDGGPQTRGLSRSNDRSLVVRIEVDTREGPRAALLCGDIQQLPMLTLLERAPDALKASILELPHHGSWQPTAPLFVDHVDPTVVLQSTGRRRVDDARWSPWRSRIGEKPGGAWLITARDGAAWAELRRDGSVRHGSTLDAATDAR